MFAAKVVAFVRASVRRLGPEDQEVEVAPAADRVHLAAPPVLGATLLGLDALGASDTAKERLRATLSATRPAPAT